MATEYPGNLIPSPTYNKPGDISVDDELLYSTAGFTQKGVTLAPGQGVLLLGTVLARRDADKLWVAYAAGGTGGAGTARGLLRQSVDTGTDEDGPRLQNNIVISGIVKLDRVDAANTVAVGDIATALGGRVDDVLGYLSF